MDFKTLLINRRAIRDFQNKEVPLSVIKEIIQDTCLAPTATNRQPCKFIIIRDRDYMKKFSDESKKTLLSYLEKDPASPLKQYEPRLRDEEFNVFYNAPCLVYVIGPKEVPSLEVDCGLTVAYFMFSATSRGLGTCWIGLGAHIRDRKMLDDMGVPKDCEIVAPVIIGYPTSIPPASERHAPEIIKVICEKVNRCLQFLGIKIIQQFFFGGKPKPQRKSRTSISNKHNSRPPHLAFCGQYLMLATNRFVRFCSK